jgi:hypothetical protein
MDYFITGFQVADTRGLAPIVGRFQIMMNGVFVPISGLPQQVKYKK